MNDELEKLKNELYGPNGWEDNVKHLLDRCPYTVRSRPGGGPEILIESLVITFLNMQARLKIVD